jgi:magnesium transporter
MRMLTSLDLDELRELRARDEFFWLDLNKPDRETLHQVAELLDLHPLAVEDTQEFGQRPKLDTYGEHLLLVYFGAADDADGVPVGVEVHLHISRRFVLTVHREPCRQFELVQEVLERHPPDNEQMLIYRVIDALTDSILDVLERVAAAVDDYETVVFHRPRARDRDRMAMLRRALGSFRRVLVIQRQVFDRAVERIVAMPGFSDGLSSYYRDAGDHLWQAIDETESARDSLQGMLETYTNEVQERLTIVATIFLPLTVITGFFGQNFTWMINHIGSTWAFWGLGVGGLLVSVTGIVWWLVRSGLYHGPGGD